MSLRSDRLEISWPLGGYDRNYSLHRPRKGVTADCLNVRAYDPATGRSRGAQRPGLSKYLAGQFSGGGRIQCLDHITISAGTSEDISATSLSYRSITGVAVSGGTVQKFDSSSFTAATNGSSALSADAPVIFSTPFFQKLYFADGANYKLYDPASNTVSAWSASAGTIPANGGSKPRLIETWRGRIVLSGLAGDRHNWFMSAVNDATDWDYSPDNVCETTAVAGNNAPAGKVGDVVNALVPYNDDLLLFGCDHSIWKMSGDPMAGGRIDRVSEVTGIAYGRAWCKDPSGRIYFFGSRGGVYRLIPGEVPDRITADRIEAQLAGVNLATTIVRLVWDDAEQGVHVFLSPLTAGETTHWFYDVRNNSWWPDQFGNNDHNPVAVHVFDGDDPDDRQILLGGEDGYIRQLDSSSASDDGTAIDSYIFLGPIRLGSTMTSATMEEVQCVTAAGSNNVTLTIHPGKTEETALAATARTEDTRTVAAGRDKSFRPRRNGDSFFIKLRNNTLGERWAFERMAVLMLETGRAWQRRNN